MLDILASSLVAGVLGDALAVVMVYFAAHQVLQEYIALSSHIPSRWFVPYESDDPFGRPEELERVRAALWGDADAAGGGAHGEAAVVGVKPADEGARALAGSREDAYQLDPGPPPSGQGGSGSEDARGTGRARWSIWRRRLFNPFVVQAYVLVLLWPVVQAILWGVGTDKPEHVAADLIVGTVCFVFTSFGFGMATTLIHPKLLAYALRRPRSTLIYSIRTINLNPQRLRKRTDHLRQLAAHLAVLAVFAGSYHGITLLQAVVPALSVYLALRFFRPQKQQVKGMAQGMMGMVLFGAAVGIFGYWRDGPGSPDDASGEERPISAWLAGLVGMCVLPLTNVVVPAVIVLLNLRFEHSLVHTPLRTLRQPVAVVPSPRFPKPVFHASIVALLLSLGATHVIGGSFEAWWFVPDGMGMLMLGWFVTVPAVVGTSLAVARWRGVDKEWSAYDEVWLPTFEQVKDMDGE